MSTGTQVPPKYRPSQRVVDDPDRLRELRVEEGLSIREIAAHPDTEVGTTRLYEALREHGIGPSSENSRRGRDPPTDTSQGVKWANVA
jgi:transposase